MDESFSLIMPIKVKPYEHQYSAFKFACEKFGLLPGSSQSKGVALLMEMGTGKTLTSIGIAGALYLSGKVKKVLVVSPLSIVCVWEQESFTLEIEQKPPVQSRQTRKKRNRL